MLSVPRRRRRRLVSTRKQNLYELDEKAGKEKKKRLKEEGKIRRQSRVKVSNYQGNALIRSQTISSSLSFTRLTPRLSFLFIVVVSVSAGRRSSAARKRLGKRDKPGKSTSTSLERPGERLPYCRLTFATLSPSLLPLSPLLLIA